MARSKKKKKSPIRRIRFYFIYGVILICIGFFGTKYHSQLYNLIPSKHKAVISDVKNVYFGIVKKFIPTFSQSPSKTDSEISGLEIPSHNESDEIIHHEYYSLQYDQDTKQANWVAYKLDKKQILNKSAKRKDDFRPDPMVKRNSATLSDYRRSGYDRGHLCPAATMRFDKTAMSETFYLSNMSPQVPQFNRGIWRKLEAKVRKWTVREGEVYVVSGPIFYKNRTHKEIGNGVDVPDAYYKVILDYREPGIKAIGFVFPNKGSSKPISSFVLPVDNVERITGIDFFPNLPDNIEEQIESRVDYSSWE